MAISSSGWSSPLLARLALQLLDLLADGAGLLLAVPGAGDLHLLAQHIFRAQRLAEPAFIVRDEMGGGREDVAGRAIVALETDDLGAGKVVIEAQDVVDLGPAPAVDRLVVVADAADVFGVPLLRSFRGRPEAGTRNPEALPWHWIPGRTWVRNQRSVLPHPDSLPASRPSRLRNRDVDHGWRSAAGMTAVELVVVCASSFSHRYCATFVS